MPLEVRFWPRVDKSGECWNWTGGISRKNGYGQFSLGRKSDGATSAHRFSWKLHFGEISDGLWVLHRCDNPKCVRSDHLFLGTSAENTADRCAKGRGMRGERQHLAKLKESDIPRIRERLANGVSQAKIAEFYGADQVTISQVKLWKTWRHVPITQKSPPPFLAQSGPARPPV